MARFLLISLIGVILIFSFLIFGRDIFSNLINRYFPFQAAVIEPISKEEEIEPEIEKEETFSESEKIALLERIDELEERVDSLSQQLADLIEKSQKIEETPEIEEITEIKEAEEEETKEERTKEEEIEEEELGQEIGQEPCEKITGVQPRQNKVIINELAWMGTINSANDEWIELKNISGAEINLAGWQILDKDKEINTFFSIRDVIPLNGFYLLERTDDNSVPSIKADLIYSGALKNSDEALYLFDENCQIEDEVLANPNWPAGDNSSKRTMERKSDLTWQTSSEPGGTPKKENSSGYIAPITGGASLSSPQEEPKINLSFPEESPVNKEIEIFFSISGLKNALYDLKISIEKEEVLSDIYNQEEGKWQSSFYYLGELFTGNSFEGQFKLKIKEDKKDFRGQAEIVAKVRESGKSSYFEFKGKINITDPELEEEKKIIFEVSPASLNFEAKFGENPEPKILYVSGNIEGVIGYYPNWLRIEKIEDGFEVFGEVSGMNPGNYEDKIQINYNGQLLKEIPISLKIFLNLLQNPYFNEWDEPGDNADHLQNWVYSGTKTHLKREEDGLVGNYSLSWSPITSAQNLIQTAIKITKPGTYYAEIWIKPLNVDNDNYLRISLDIANPTDGGFPRASFIDYKSESDWIKMTKTRDLGAGENGGLRIRAEREGSAGPSFLIGAAWLGMTEPPQNWPF